jgi:LysM repeat protein
MKSRMVTWRVVSSGLGDDDLGDDDLGVGFFAIHRVFHRLGINSNKCSKNSCRCRWGVVWFTYRTSVRKPSPRFDLQQERRTMSTMTLPTYRAKVSVNQGFQANPSTVTLNRRGRLARTFVVLSLAIVLGSLVSAKAGAGTTAAPTPASSFITVTVAPGETVWSLANRLSGGSDVRSLVSEIISANSLASVDLSAGQKLRIPLK